MRGPAGRGSETPGLPCPPSVVSSTDLYTKADDARGRQGAKSEHIGHL